MMGHSMGGWVTSQVAAGDADLAGAALISAADMGERAGAPKAQRVAIAADNMEALAGVNAETMADQMAELGPFTFAAATPGLAKKPLLVLTSDDGLAPGAEKLAMDVKQRGGRVAIVHAATDHGWNTARVRLASEILNWLATLPK
jgi:pimeloyl-ACP methyl ester carboxylesterase